MIIMSVMGQNGSTPGVAIRALTLTNFQSLVLGGLNQWAHALGNTTGAAALKTLDLTQANQLIYGIVLVAMMLYRRQGLIPARRFVGALSVSEQTVVAGRGGFKPTFVISEPDPTHKASEPLLVVNGLVKRFGGLVAADHIDLIAYPGEIGSVIGPNGSGKTTPF